MTKDLLNSGMSISPTSNHTSTLIICDVFILVINTNPIYVIDCVKQSYILVRGTQTLTLVSVYIDLIKLHLMRMVNNKILYVLHSI